MHCLALTKPKIVLVDVKDVQVLSPVRAQLKEKGVGPIYSWNNLAHLPAHTTEGVTVSHFSRPR